MGNDGNKVICYGLIIRPVDQRGGVLDSRLGRRRKTGAPPPPTLNTSRFGLRLPQQLCRDGLTMPQTVSTKAIHTREVASSNRTTPR